MISLKKGSQMKQNKKWSKFAILQDDLVHYRHAVLLGS